MGMNALVLRLTLVSGGMGLPAFAGSVWHGGLGAVLHEESPHAFNTLYQVGEEARLYSLVPPAGGTWPARQRRQLQVSLFGPASSCALAVMQALLRLGAVGLRPGGRFEVEAIESLALDGQGTPQLLYTARGGLLAVPTSVELEAAWVRALAQQLRSPPVGLEMHLLSPLRIKEQNKDLRVAPSCGQLLRRVLSRAEQLAHASGIELPWLREGRAEWLAQASTVALAQADVAWQMLERRSARSGQNMSFGGLQGSLTYAGVPPAVAAWLLLAQGLQVGGKTAFGFGGVAVAAAQAVPEAVESVETKHSKEVA
jgi:hypothetical protein